MAKVFNFAVLILMSMVLIGPAQAWDQDTDSLILCNKNNSHDINVAYASKAVPWGIAALIGAGWHRAGWWVIKAGKCELTMPLRDVQNYEIWLYVEVINGGQIHWEHRLNEQFCIHGKNGFEISSMAKNEIQACREGEAPATFSYMGSLYNVDDRYSIYNFENRTINLNFTYNQPPGHSKPALEQNTAPAPAPKAKQAQKSNNLKSGVPPAPAIHHLVQICTPLITQQNGDFLPAAKKAIDNGDMKRHFDQINEVINAMKNDQGSPLNQTAKATHVQLVVSPYFEQKKTVRVLPIASVGNLRCQTDYRQATYDATAWLKKPDLSPAGLPTK